MRPTGRRAAGVPREQLGQPRVEGGAVPGGQGAQRAQGRGVRLVQQRRAGLVGAGTDALQGRVDGGELGLRGRRILLRVARVARVVEDHGHEPGGEFPGGRSLRLPDELLPGEVEGLAVPRRLVPESGQAERLHPFPWPDALRGGVVAPVVAQAEVHVLQEDLEGRVRVVGRTSDGTGRRLGRVLEGRAGFRGVEVGRVDGQRAQVVEELSGDRLPFTGSDPAAP